MPSTISDRRMNLSDRAASHRPPHVAKVNMSGDRRRSLAITQLARALLEARHDLEKIFHALESSLTAIAPHSIVAGALLDGTVTVTPDHDGPLDDDDLAMIATCIEYAGIAADSALAIRAERERTSQFQEAMLGIVGHDLQGPLGAIIIGTEILEMESKDPAGAPVVARIGSFARRMTRMVDQLLDLTHARLGGGIPLARRNTRLLPLVRFVLEAQSRAHPKHRFDLVEAADVIGVWDPDRLAQVTSYLLSNAAHYGLEGAPITVAVGQGIGVACMTVHNELRAGLPISTALLATMFEPRRREGVGLDLYLVHEIIRAHGGTITVESSRAGTTFRLTLPTPDHPA
jgi:sigma-B regulation protein RsbU (phosphoserine phosphatase)